MRDEFRVCCRCAASPYAFEQSRCFLSGISGSPFFQLDPANSITYCQLPYFYLTGFDAYSRHVRWMVESRQ